MMVWDFEILKLGWGMEVYDFYILNVAGGKYLGFQNPKRVLEKRFCNFGTF
jgi:hypothetical protein